TSVTGAQGVVSGNATFNGAEAGGAVAYLMSQSRSVGTPGAALIDQRGLRFVPNAVVVPPGSDVAFMNSDSVRHNVFSPKRGGAGFDLGSYHSGEQRVRRFDSTGVYVILCDVHPEMAAHVYVVPSSWNALSDSTGSFRITGVPAGVYTLVVQYRRRALAQRSIRVLDGDSTHASMALLPLRRAGARRPSQ
ncbi:MAG: carboxypeptidase regulatory-like domain-containing protein, partial [Gemmatimonadota bacterium]